MNYRVINQRPAVYVLDPRFIQNRLDAAFFMPEYADFDKAVSTLDFEVFELGSRRSTSLLTHMPGFSKDKWVRYVPEGIPYLLQTNVQDGFVDPTGWEHITPEAHRNLPTSSLKPGDVLLTATGMHYGKAAVVPEWLREANACPDIFHIVLRKHVDPYYAVAFINSRYGQIELRRHGSGANRPRIITEYVRLTRLVLPPRLVQEYIGAKVRLAERCRLRARELKAQCQLALDQLFIGVTAETQQDQAYWVKASDLDNPRIDAWHYQPAYRKLVRECHERDFVPLSRFADLSRHRWSPAGRETGRFNYVEISDVDVSTGLLTSTEMPVAEAPSRARKLTNPNDILISTVRPERKGIGIVTLEMENWVASTGFSVITTRTPELAWYFVTVLRHDSSTMQLMRWNTGATYPAIEEDVPLRVLVPDPGIQCMKEVGSLYEHQVNLLKNAVLLIREARADVEALIEGRLDADGIMAGRVRPPTWDELDV